MRCQDYLKKGFKVIPLQVRSKEPCFKQWNKQWYRKTAQIITFFQKHPNANIGVLLGDFLDIEADDEAANELLDLLVSDYPHPTYQSSKSRHHLFRNIYPSLTRKTFNGIEFRAFKHQSVLPPSIHPDGTVYTWIDFNGGEVPNPPYKIIQYLRQRKVFPAGKYLMPWCSECGRNLVVKKRNFQREIEVFRRLGQKWQCVNCRSKEVTERCKSLKYAKRKVERQKRRHIRRQQKDELKIGVQKGRRARIDIIRKRLLKVPGKGEKEFGIILDILTECYGKKLFKYKRQRPFIVPEAKYQEQFFFIDFFIYPFRMCIEIDGSSHNRKSQQAWDRWRSSILESHKIKVVRFSDKLVLRDPGAVVKELLEEMSCFDGWVGKDLIRKFKECPVYLAQAYIEGKFRKHR